jgi:hypothetical protein
MMSEWKRITQEVPFGGLMTEMVDAVNKHIELYNLGTILSDVLMCIQTDSEKAKKGLFGKAETVHQGSVVTPRWLLWVVMASSNKAAVLSAQLSDVVVQDYAQTQFAKMIPDSGIQVNGKFTDVSENASAFIGLEDGDVGRKFTETVITAVQNSKK